MSMVDKLKNFRLRWFTDNKNVAHILLVGSKKPLLQVVVLKVFSLAVQNQIRLEPEWIPRHLNKSTDYLSHKIVDDDWQLNPSVFSVLDKHWGAHSIDRFASFHNCQVPRFNRYWNLGSEAIEAFTLNWSGKNNWLCPPIGLVLRVIQHALACGAEECMVVPWWSSAAFRPLLCLCNKGFLPSLLERLGSSHR